jgi:hypothetical protein
MAYGHGVFALFTIIIICRRTCNRSEARFFLPKRSRAEGEGVSRGRWLQSRAWIVGLTAILVQIFFFFPYVGYIRGLMDESHGKKLVPL